MTTVRCGIVSVGKFTYAATVRPSKVQHGKVL